MLEHGSDGFFSIGRDWRYSFVSEGGARLAGRPGDDVRGEIVWDTFPELEESTFGDALKKAMDSREATQHEAYYAPFDAWYEMKVYPTENGLSVYFRDVTEVKERAQQFEAILNNTYTILGLLDVDGTLVEVNDTALEFTDGDREAVIGNPLWEFDPFDANQDAKTTAHNAVDHARRGEQFQDEIGVRCNGREAVIHVTVRPITNEKNEVTQLIFEGRDITEREMLTQELRRERDFVETALDTLTDVFYVVGTGGELRRWNSSLTAVSGYPDDAIADMQAVDFFPADEAEPISAAIEETLETGKAVVEADFLTADGARIPYQFTGARLTDTEDNLIGLVGIGRDITERKRRERELRQQRERLEALNSLNMIVRDVTDAVIEQSTREEIEQIACEKLADSQSYSCAWIVDTDSNSLNMRSSAEKAGSSIGHADSQPVLTQILEESPVAETCQTGKPKVAQDISEDPNFEVLRDVMTDREFRSVISVPIVHNEIQFGVLGVHSQRTDAFDQNEREIITQLGEIIGYVFYAIERKEMLGSALEFEFRSEQLAESFSKHSDEDVGLALDTVVPLDRHDNEFIEYWEIDAGFVEEFKHFVDLVESESNARLLGIVDGTARLDVAAKSGSMSSALAEQGGTLQSAHLNEHAMQITGEFPESVDPEMITGELRDRFPDIELVSQKRVLTPQYLRQTLDENLTDRQQTVLQIAHFGGYFDHPRRSTGAELAAHLEITKQTFHHHLRKAESTVCDILFEDPADPLI